MSVRTEAAPRKGRRRDRPSTEGSEPAKTKYLPHPEPKVEKKAKRKDPSREGEVDDSKARKRSRTGDEPTAEAEAKERRPEPKAEKRPEPKAERPAAKVEKRPEPEAKAEKRPEVDAKSDTLPEAKVAQADAEEAEAKLARATDDRPARRGFIVVRGGSRGDGAQLWAVLALAASVIGAGVAIALQPGEERAPAPRVEAAIQPPPPALTPPARPERKPAAPPAEETRGAGPAATAIDQDLTEAVETLLAAGRERSAIELLASSRPSPTVTRAREHVLTRAREVLDAAAGELRASAGRGEPSTPRLARLRARLPESLSSELDALAAELSAIEGLASAKARTRPAEPVRSKTPAAAPEELEPEPIPVGPLAGRRMPPRPEPTEPADEPAGAEPAGAEPPAREPARREPEPEPRSEPESEPASAGESSPDADAVLADALRDRLKANHRVRNGGFDVDYCFTSDTDRQDWDGHGWDKFEINGVMGLATNHTSSSIALELGAGSNGAGVLHHALELAGDYTLEVGCWVAHSSARSQFVILAGKGGGVRWGTQLVKVSRGGGLEPLGPEPDRMGFRGERDVTIKVVRKGDTLEGTLNGASTGVKTFKPGELDGKVGIFASDVRLVITRFRIAGKVDPRKL
jgi:hypothetical protein